MGTIDCAVKYCEFFNENFDDYNNYLNKKIFSHIKTISIDRKLFPSDECAINKIISYAYDINYDNDFMKKNQKLQTLEKSNCFKEFRKNYPSRREFSNIKIKLSSASEEFKLKLERLGFIIPH